MSVGGEVEGSCDSSLIFLDIRIPPIKVYPWLYRASNCQDIKVYRIYQNNRPPHRISAFSEQAPPNDHLSPKRLPPNKHLPRIRHHPTIQVISMMKFGLNLTTWKLSLKLISSPGAYLGNLFWLPDFFFFIFKDMHKLLTVLRECLRWNLKGR